MDSISIGWNKQTTDEIQFKINKPVHQRDLISETPKKKVHFECSTPTAKQQAFEDIQSHQIETNQRQGYGFEDHAYISSSADLFASQISTIPDESICSGRVIAITFIMIVSIILIVAIAVGIVFGMIKMGHSNSTTNGSHHSVSISIISPTASTTVLTSSVSIGSQSGAPCLSYTTINDPSRNILQTQYRPCDDGPLFNSSNNGTWIRFIGSGGSIMPSSPPRINHCGGYSPGWFNGTLPTIQGTMANGAVCFNSDRYSPLTSYDSTVIYCTGGYYIYFLMPVKYCNARHCTV